MIGTGTLVNVATGSGMKILSYAAGRIIDGFFETQKQAVEAAHAKTDQMVRLQSGNDTADDWTKHTRRILAWMLCFTACFILVNFALTANETIPMLIDRDRGIFGWIFGGTSQRTEFVSKAQMIMNMWSLLEIMFGFYFTKIGTHG